MSQHWGHLRSHCPNYGDGLWRRRGGASGEFVGCSKWGKPSCRVQAGGKVLQTWEPQGWCGLNPPLELGVMGSQARSVRGSCLLTPAHSPSLLLERPLASQVLLSPRAGPGQTRPLTVITVVASEDAVIRRPTGLTRLVLPPHSGPPALSAPFFTEFLPGSVPGNPERHCEEPVESKLSFSFDITRLPPGSCSCPHPLPLFGGLGSGVSPTGSW